MLSSRRKIVFLVLVCAAVIMYATGGGLWYTNVYLNKERRFWAAIGNGLRIASVTKEVTQDTPNGNTVQLTRMSFGANPYVESKTKVYNRTSTTTNSTIITRSLETANESLVQYESIDTNEKKDDGGSFDFSNVTGVWANRGAESDVPGSNVQQLAESYIQLVPFAMLDEQSASNFVDKLKATNAYTVDFNSTQEDSENNLTVYNVTVNAKAYVVVLSEIFEQQGFGEVPALDASQYDETSTIKILLAIDGTNVVRKIAFSESEYESYRDYGAVVPAPQTGAVISFNDLQKRLQSTR